MAGNLALQRPGWIAQALALYAGRVDDEGLRYGSIAEDVAPRPEERERMEQRRELLVAALRQPAQGSVGLRDLTMGLVDTFRPYLDLNSCAGRAEQYAIAVEEFPLWAIEEAKRRIFKKHVIIQSPGHGPSPVELAGAVQEVLAPVYEEHRALARILDARVIPANTPEVRERMIAGFSALIEQLVATNASLKNDPNPPRRMNRGDVISAQAQEDAQRRREALAAELEERRQRRLAWEQESGVETQALRLPVKEEP